MVSDHSLSTDDEVVDNSVSRPQTNRNNSGKVPKKIHKAEREKLKRDHLNELFLELGQALDSTRQNNGKASILGDTTRLLRELLTQLEGLKKENVALATETRYITVEKNELKDENTILGTEIEKLQNQLQERMQSVHAWCGPPDAASIQMRQHNSASSSMEDQRRPMPAVDPVLQPAPLVGPPIFVLPQAYPESDIIQVPCKPPTRVMRPHARYPTASDSWPLQLLDRRLETTTPTQETQLTLGPGIARENETV